MRASGHHALGARGRCSYQSPQAHRTVARGVGGGRARAQPTHRKRRRRGPALRHPPADPGSGRRHHRLLLPLRPRRHGRRRRCRSPPGQPQPRLLATLAGALMAFARVYIGAHTPGMSWADSRSGRRVTLLGWVLLAHPLMRLTGRLRRQPAGYVANPDCARYSANPRASCPTWPSIVT